jgi:hypothetical protein
MAAFRVAKAKMHCVERTAVPLGHSTNGESAPPFALGHAQLSVLRKPRG